MIGGKVRLGLCDRSSSLPGTHAVDWYLNVLNSECADSLEFYLVAAELEHPVCSGQMGMTKRWAQGDQPRRALDEQTMACRLLPVWWSC
jgi:hypothetical protein